MLSAVAMLVRARRFPPRDRRRAGGVRVSRPIAGPPGSCGPCPPAPGGLQHLRSAYPHDPRLVETSGYLIEYPFAERLYPGALDTVHRLNELAQTVILSDGDVVLQPRKIHRSGLWAAVDGDVLVYVHKEHELDDVERHYPAEHYVIVDDKLRILDAIKHGWDRRVTTVFLRQGHYATDEGSLESYSPADLALDAIGELVDALIDANALPNR